MSTPLKALGDVDRTIHEPARLMIVSLLYLVREADFNWLLHQTELTKGNLSAHMAKLEQAAYIDVEKRFQGKMPQTLYRLNKAGRKVLEQYRAAMRKALDYS